MILILAVVGLVHNNDPVNIIASSSSEVIFEVVFDQQKADENTPITRFIISDAMPGYAYEVIEEIPAQHTDNFDPTIEPLMINQPIHLQGHTIYPVHIFPSYIKNNITSNIKIIKIRVFSIQTKPIFELTPAFVQAFQGLILNPCITSDNKPQGYLIIVPDALYNDVLPLARWKEKKGWYVAVATLSQTGSTPASIKNYIANAYHDTISLEYVLLIGDHGLLPAYSTITPVSYTDHPYSLIEGNDILSDVLLGRLPAANTTELSTMVAKILGYEIDPYIIDPSWFKRALVVAANYPIAIMTTPIPTKRLIRERMLDYGYNAIDTVFYPPSSGSAEITASINQGVGFINYRGGDADPDGWIHPNFHNTEVTGLSNGWKLPIVTSIVCLNGNFGYATCFGEAWLRAGNAVNPRGAVAFFGASAATTSSRWNNCLDMGIYYGVFHDKITLLGPALYRGKLEVFMNFPLDTTWASGTSFYFHTYNLLGDPSLDMWTAIPDTFVVTHNASLPVGSSIMTVQVRNAASQPVENALVSCYKEDEVKVVSYTDASGNASFTFRTTIADSLFVTVSEHNFKPYCGHCIITSNTVYVGYDSHTIDDSGGNNNGALNPGEPIDLAITLRNYGTSTTATNVNAILRTNDPYITITDSSKSYGSITPGNIATASPFSFTISSNTPHDHPVVFTLAITSSQGNWDAGLTIPVQAPLCAFLRDQIIDGNGILEPGETSDMTITIKNIGALSGQNTSGVLRSHNTAVVVTDANGNFGTIAINDSTTNSGDPFTVSASANVSPGHPIKMSAIISYANCSKTDTLLFELIIGEVVSIAPTGPDDYGYFAYDNTDTGCDECPIYNWIEIDPLFSGPGDSLYLENDQTKTIALPFAFQYYAADYNRISICSNGYIAMDSTWVADMYNWHIGAAGGPPLLIAPFWDDFDPNATDSSGRVCYWNDASNHRFIVEYSRVQHIHDPTNPTPAELQTFEIILYDPQYCPTLTGDGEIIFQYYDITNDDIWHNYATVGIENVDHTIGLEYSYANEYPNSAAVLTDGRAIKFTTDPPDTFPGVLEHGEHAAAGYMMEVYPNPFRNELSIAYHVGHNAHDVTIHIYDITGRLVRLFSLPTAYCALPTVLSWNGTDKRGIPLPQGVYFIHMRVEEQDLHTKAILLR
ncbi:hypothetical protein JXB22_05580 [candidate division WOR-3 bacterium]|nr:hypothetical protein [candidate division WOR-3 bacterium]